VLWGFQWAPSLPVLLIVVESNEISATVAIAIGAIECFASDRMMLSP
jgi:hypothetical protein